MGFEFDNWYQGITKDNTIISYQGEITSELIEETLDNIEIILIEKGLKKKKVKKAYNAIVEELQNLYHHASHEPGKNPKNKFGSFCIKLKDDVIDIITGNYVIFNIVQLLKDRMDQLNMLSKDDLKLLYKKILSNNSFSEKGGGGLGMVDLAKRTGSKLEYNFFEFDEKYYFFELTIRI